MSLIRTRHPLVIQPVRDLCTIDNPAYPLARRGSYYYQVTFSEVIDA